MPISVLNAATLSAEVSASIAVTAWIPDLLRMDEIFFAVKPMAISALMLSARLSSASAICPKRTDEFFLPLPPMLEMLPSSNSNSVMLLFSIIGNEHYLNTLLLQIYYLYQQNQGSLTKY